MNKIIIKTQAELDALPASFENFTQIKIISPANVWLKISVKYQNANVEARGSSHVEARFLFGARMGIGEGQTGQCYAIPTKNESILPRDLKDIEISVGKFISHAKNHPESAFLVTEIGCGLAGFSPEQIAPMFADAPANCVLPDAFKAVLEGGLK